MILAQMIAGKVNLISAARNIDFECTLSLWKCHFKQAHNYIYISTISLSPSKYIHRAILHVDVSYTYTNQPKVIALASIYLPSTPHPRMPVVASKGLCWDSA